jgi:hypothetical protein
MKPACRAPLGENASFHSHEKLRSKSVAPVALAGTKPSGLFRQSLEILRLIPELLRTVA